ncbi:MAG: hypothetical protein QNJ42_03440 [Crocosphaera sp.]|nr:hypothetical protein [Crocosphaera sp.]
MFLIPQVSATTWIIWIMLNILYPTYIYTLILNIILPNITTLLWGLVFLVNAPPLGFVFLVYVVVYAFIFWLISLGCSLLIDKLPYIFLKIFALILIFLILLKPTFSPIYGSGSGFRAGNLPGKNLWQWYNIVQ